MRTAGWEKQRMQVLLVVIKQPGDSICKTVPNSQEMTVLDPGCYDVELQSATTARFVKAVSIRRRRPLRPAARDAMMSRWDWIDYYRAIRAGGFMVGARWRESRRYEVVEQRRGWEDAKAGRLWNVCGQWER
jgi:hypothetical protein